MRDSHEQRNGYLCGFNKPRSCAFANRHSASVVGVTSSSISEGYVRVYSITKAVLGPIPVGARLVGDIEWKCDG